jgi:hypothetical protein
VKSANQAQNDNTALFLKSLTAITGELNDLKSKVATESLQKRIATLQEELQKTQQALAPGPKASLVLSFHPPIERGDKVLPVVETVSSRLPDGSVHLVCTIINTTETVAQDVNINFHICDSCVFAKASAAFATKVPAQSNSERDMTIRTVLPKTKIPFFLDVVPPPDLEHFEIAMIYRCRTCVVETQMQKAVVRLVKAAVQK